MNILIVSEILKKPVDKLENKNFFSELKNKCPDDKEIE